MKNETYNGWTNYSTWRIDLELIDTDYYSEVLNNNEYDNKDEAVSILANTIQNDIESYLETDCDNETTLSYALAFISDVNWYEIAEGIYNNYIENK